MQIPPSLKALFRGLGSLRLSVFLLGFSVLLVFFGTLDQVRIGIRDAQKIYFESILAVWYYPEIWPLGNILKWIPVPLPGGYLIGPLLAVNLIFSHIRFWRPRWSILGISFIHVGIILLLVGQLVTNLFQKESYLWLDEGDQASYVRSFSDDELYLNKVLSDGKLGVYAIPFEDLKEGTEIKTPFPFSLRVREVFGNAEIAPVGNGSTGSTFGVSRGIGAQFNLAVKKLGSFHSDSQRDVRTAVVEIIKDGETAGTWLVSNLFEDRFDEQGFQLDGQTYQVGMRYKQTPLDYTITLLDFRHDRYPGTNIPKNFSSMVRLEHPEKGVDKEVMVFMNNPLRYEGLTFYQASFAKQDTASMFQVVRNPGWLIPYIACTLVSIGLFYQFSVAGYRMVRRMN